MTSRFPAPWSDLESLCLLSLINEHGLSYSDAAEELRRRGYPQRTRCAIAGRVHKIKTAYAASEAT